MTTSSANMVRRGQSGHQLLAQFGHFYSSVVASWLMSDNKRHWVIFERSPNPTDAFMDYLEGYASSIDMYSVCSRPYRSSYDIGSVVDNFWKVAADYAASADAYAQHKDALAGSAKGRYGKGFGTKGN